MTELKEQGEDNKGAISLQASLHTLPSEILSMILDGLGKWNLLSVARTCKRLLAHVYAVCETEYGSGPKPFPPDPYPCSTYTSSNYPSSTYFSIKFTIWFLSHCHTDPVEKNIEGLLSLCYIFKLDHLHLALLAEIVICKIHKKPEDYCDGMEAIIAALSLQGRQEEALEYYNACTNMSPERTALLKARFDLGPSIQWAALDDKLRKRALYAAATSGNMKLFGELWKITPLSNHRMHGFFWSEHHEAIRAAVMGGTLDIITVLLPSPEQEQENWRYALQWAIEHDRDNIVEFLFQGGIVPTESDLKRALEYGSIKSLHLLKKQSGIKIGTYFADGRLQIACVLLSRLRIWRAVISFLIKESSADINATGQDGRTVYQETAGLGDEKRQFLIENGAYIMPLDYGNIYG